MGKNLQEEKQWLMSIPVDGNIVFVQDKNALVADKAGFSQMKLNLRELWVLFILNSKPILMKKEQKHWFSSVKLIHILLLHLRAKQSREGIKRK